MSSNNPITSIEHYATLFETFESRLNGGARHAIHAVRQAALKSLRDEGFPTHRDEAWRHTNPAPLSTPAFTPAETVTADPETISPWTVAGLSAGPRLVFVNGRYVEDASRAAQLPEGVRVRRLAEAITAGDAAVTEHLGRSESHCAGGFAALNTAFLDDGVLVFVDAGVTLEAPVEILHITRPDSTPTLVTPRTLIVAAAGSRLQVMETFVSLGEGDYLTAPVTEVVLAAGAHVEHTRLQSDTDVGHHASVLHVQEGEDATFISHSLGLGGRLVRNDVTTVLAGERISSTLNGLFLSRGQEHIDNYTSIEHAAPNCESHELYKGVLTDKAQGVFRGKIHVHQIAQQTDAYQSNQNLLLSDDAGIMSKPQLEIYADDVKCSHGSTTGELDEDAMFYLRTRGIGKATAMQVLTRAFADELVDRISNPVIRQHVELLVTRRLNELLDGGATS
ncbi:MAG: Fe-S cluster assembly protein SufD [Gemmatimonadetes bacterium]|jgi:Fe-S cluster assembly protein SufD|nr:Fe-S cluster assembly protein SufD [Gemmatimonadota bacterium]MBT6149198.1 Fe-S cluster assembly protein SufD [Gemmatimonadota bacterium]MBT7860479.1 Fe-S cluster assembly protein SufD [Gemmatimonadota bacterium]